ncbi:hypothetical protein [Halobacillus salinus]|uniref:Uncharacterized protein n=1 Tax=Halobacillus salinus TaxID=192814 RepID=A0A4Z0GXM0_9BACI|nr:hypothetical protein [Halobacillus salinus]TGB02485.1 hypothetical protein E4663_14205 [Halobacillus salinus]
MTTTYTTDHLTPRVRVIEWYKLIWITYHKIIKFSQHCVTYGVIAASNSMKAKLLSNELLSVVLVDEVYASFK